MIRKSYKNLEKFFKKNILKIIGILLLFTLFFIFRDFLTILVFIAIGSLSMFHQRFTQSWFGFELATFFTILGAMKYGALAGMIIGVISITIGLALSGHIHHTIIISMAGFLFIGLLASFFPVSQIFWVGMILTVLYDIVTVPIYIFLGSNPASSVSYFVTHIIMNYFVFSRGAYFLGLV